MGRRKRRDRRVERQIGKNIVRRRATLDMSRAELARRAQLSYSEVSAIERGEREPLGSTLMKIAGALEVSVTDLYAGARWVTPGEDGGDGHLEVDGRR